MSQRHERPNPYDLVFGAEAMDDTLFPPIGQEAETRGMLLDDPERFVFLTSVGRLIQAIAGGPATAEPESETGAPAEAGGHAGEVLRQHGLLLYHAFQFWRAGKRELELDEAALRRLLEDDDVAGDRSLTTPAPAGYLRLPRNLVWAAPDADLQPEPADGFFWVHRRLEGGPPELHLLMVLGVRADRPGFSVVSASGTADHRPHWADVDARPGAPDFATTLPGGELDRLYSIETPTELLKLASRCFLALDDNHG